MAGSNEKVIADGEIVRIEKIVNNDTVRLLEGQLIR